MDMMNVKRAMEMYQTLTKDEQGAFLVLITTVNEVIAKQQAAAPTKPTPPRGRYACPVCHKVLPTKRGRGIHLAHHAEDEAKRPERAPSKESK